MDDILAFFRSVAQYFRLLPLLVNMLAEWGLEINVSKFCTFGLIPPAVRLSVLTFVHGEFAVYLGVQVHEGDELMLQALIRKTKELCGFLLLLASFASARCELPEAPLVVSGLGYQLYKMDPRCVDAISEHPESPPRSAHNLGNVHAAGILSASLPNGTRYSTLPACSAQLVAELFDLVGPAARKAQLARSVLH